MKLEKQHIQGLIKAYMKEAIDAKEDERIMAVPVPDFLFVNRVIILNKKGKAN